MFKFGGFKASLNLGSTSKKKEIYENGPTLSVGGAYRTHREELFGHGGMSEPPKKLTPSMVKLPPSAQGAIKTSKSASELANPHNLPPQLRKSTPDVSTDPRGGPSHNRDSSALHRNAKTTSREAKRDSKKHEKEQKDLEKKRIAEQKKKEKAEAQEQAKKDKLRIQRDRQIAQQQARDVKLRKEQEKNKKKGPVPQAPQPAAIPQAQIPRAPIPQAPNPQAPIPRAPIPQAATPRAPIPQASTPRAPIPQAPIPQASIPPPPPPQRANPLGKQTAYSTNTLESSISRSSGPPPYSEVPRNAEPNRKDNTGNTSFGRPIESSSWDMISEHRHQISRTVANEASTKQMMIDLQFSFERAQANDRNNSEV